MAGGHNILYLSYWGVNDVLTMSSVLPTLRCLSKFDNVPKIIFCSVERTGAKGATPALPPKVIHVPLISKSGGNTIVTKIFDFTRFPVKLLRLINEHKIDTIICRSSLAGGMIWSVARLKNIPVIVESFEPHSDYMIESDIWTPGDVRTRSSRKMEAQLKAGAAWLLPVSENYHRQLLTEGVPASRMEVVPCTVQPEQFAFDASARNAIRSQSGWNDMIVGIYVGKFGGIYYEAEAFEQFSKAFGYFGDRMAMIILTAQEGVRGMITKYMRNIPEDRIRVLSVPHASVPGYLSAADFAFSTIKPAPSRKFCSPIKHAEYWANGLPIILENGIGDDSNIIRAEGGGVILQRPDYASAFAAIESLIKKGRKELYTDISRLAEKYRNEKLIETAYRKILQ